MASIVDTPDSRINNSKRFDDWFTDNGIEEYKTMFVTQGFRNLDTRGVGTGGGAI